jgi:antitoxin HicB
MIMPRNQHVGSRFENFLRDEGILEAVDARVQKRVIAEQLREAMKERSISEAALARVMKTSRTVVRSLLDPESDSATLVTLTRAARAVGRELRISFEPIAERRARVPAAARSRRKPRR